MTELAFDLPGDDADPGGEPYLDAVARRESRADVASLRHLFAAGSVAVVGARAVDPATQTYVVNSSDVVQVYKLIKRAEFDAQFKQFQEDRKAGKDARPPGSPEYGSPYAAHIYTFLNKWGMPCWAPPYGTLSSYDLKTGQL